MMDRTCLPRLTTVGICVAAFAFGFLRGGVRVAGSGGEGLLDLTPKGIAVGITSWYSVVAWLADRIGVSALDLANGVSASAAVVAVLVFRDWCVRVPTDARLATRATVVLCSCSLFVFRFAAADSFSLQLLGAALAVRGLVSNASARVSGPSSTSWSLGLLGIALAAWTGGLAATVVAVGLAQLASRRDSRVRDWTGADLSDAESPVVDLPPTGGSYPSTRLVGLLSVVAMVVTGVGVSNFQSVLGDLWAIWLRPLFPLSLVGLLLIARGSPSGLSVALVPMVILALGGEVRDHGPALAPALFVLSIPIALEVARGSAPIRRNALIAAGLVVGLLRFVGADQRDQRIAFDAALQRWLEDSPTALIYVADAEDRVWWRLAAPHVATVLVAEAVEVCDSILLDPIYAASLEPLIRADVERRAGKGGVAFITQPAEMVLRDRSQRHHSPGAVRLLDHLLDDYETRWVSDGPLRGRELRLD